MVVIKILRKGYLIVSFLGVWVFFIYFCFCSVYDIERYLINSCSIFDWRIDRFGCLFIFIVLMEGEEKWRVKDRWEIWGLVDWDNSGVSDK